MTSRRSTHAWRSQISRDVACRKTPQKPSQADAFAIQARAAGLPEPVRELRFAAATHQRQWRFDFAWPEINLALEIEGLVIRRVGGKTLLGGRHATLLGMTEDCRKYATAALLGWYLIRVTQDMVKRGEALRIVEQFIVSRLGANRANLVRDAG